jgi:hypothetical protein
MLSTNDDDGWEVNKMTDDEADMYYDRWLIAKNTIKRLEAGIMEMKQTIANRENEIERLTKKCDIQANILRRLTPEKFPDTLFISGVLGERDLNNMPQKLLVVPAYGVDFSYIYELTEKTTGPEW